MAQFSGNEGTILKPACLIRCECKFLGLPVNARLCNPDTTDKIFVPVNTVWFNDIFSSVQGLKMTESNDLSRHILPTSAQLVGVCITVISLVKVLHIGQIGSMLDKLLAIDAFIFTVSASLSYASMRRRESAALEKYADYFFMLGLFELGACAILLSFEII